eukprot:1194967-Prorocentrum_minimum.AAC.4
MFLKCSLKRSPETNGSCERSAAAAERCYTGLLCIVLRFPPPSPISASRVWLDARRTNHTQEAWVYSHDGPIVTQCDALARTCEADAVNGGPVVEKFN